MTRQELENVRTWADEKLATGHEPPWAWYQYMKLRETLDAILAGIENTAVHHSKPMLHIVGEANAAGEYSTKEIPVNLPF